MADQLTPAQIAGFREIFSFLDENGFRSISSKELGIAIRALGLDPIDAEVEDMIKDVDGNGTLDFPEFLSLMTRKMNDVDTDEEIDEAFRVLDVDGNGMVDVDDLKKAMTNLGEPLTDEFIKAMIREADIDGDGQISFSEFVTMLKSK